MSSEIDPTKPSHYNNLNSTSQEVAAFIAAIAANPDDDTARLVFADWISLSSSCPTIPARSLYRHSTA
jgi:hypothetical protein